MTGENTGVTIGATGLALFAGAVIAIKVGALDALITVATPVGLVVLVVLIGVGALGLMSQGARSGSGRGTAGRMVSGHGHGPSRTIARHEAGHAAAARALGGRVISGTADRHGGYVHAVLPNSSQAAITFWRAGRRAAGTSAGCSADDQLVQAELRRVPRSERRQLLRDADADARRIVRRNSGQISRDARTLERKGRL